MENSTVNSNLSSNRIEQQQKKKNKSTGNTEGTPIQNQELIQSIANLLLHQKKNKKPQLQPIKKNPVQTRFAPRQDGQLNDSNQVESKIDKKLKEQQQFFKKQKQQFLADYQEEKETFQKFETQRGTYLGCFLKGLRRGKGKFTWKDGAIYNGNWKNGQMQGFGQYYSTNGDLYQGKWKDGVKQGFGKEVYHKNGEVYVGYFKNGQRCGYGRYNYKNGDFYIGQFTKNLKQGRGCYYFKNDDQMTGIFIRNQIEGFGQYYWAQSKVKYQGNFKDGKLQGQGQLINAEGKGKQVLFKNDKFLNAK